MKIWVCGAQGMLGLHLQQMLKEHKLPFVANDYQQIDITNLESVSDFVRLQKITHIINCAAYTQVDKAEEEMKKAYLINAMGPYHLGKAGRRHSARVIHFSTDYVFDGKGHDSYAEEDSCSPSSAYGMSKWAGEIKLLEENDQACIIRTSWLFGVYGKNFVETMLSLMLEKDHLSIVSDQIGRPTYCEDLAKATLELLEAQGIFHFANSCETSWYAFATEIYDQASALGFPLKVKSIKPISTDAYPTAAKRPAYSTLCTCKVESLGIFPRPWQIALSDCLLQKQSQFLVLNHV